MGKDGLQQRGWDRIKQGPNLIVTGNLRESKERVGIALPFALRHIPLISEKGRTLGEEYRKGPQRGIAHGVVFVFAFAEIWKRRYRCTHRAQKIRERGGFAH